MSRLVVVVVMLLVYCVSQAKEESQFYQIDLIVFTHEQSTLPKELSLSTTRVASQSSVTLQTEVSKHLSPYHLLPPSISQLREEYWALHRKPQYRVLLNYSWLQPLTNQQRIELPKLNRDGWQVEGSLQIERKNYYLLDSELLFSNEEKQHSFLFAQNQRLKGGEIYYLDHPQVGMIIKIHQLNS